MTRFISLAVMVAEAGMEGGAVALGLGVGACRGACDITGVGVCESADSFSLSSARNRSSSSFCLYHPALSLSVLSAQVITFRSAHLHCWSAVQSGQ
jgi:hypothetical protein